MQREERKKEMILELDKGPKLHLKQLNWVKQYIACPYRDEGVILEVNKQTYGAALGSADIL